MDPSSALSQALGPAILAALQARVAEDQVQVLLAQLGQKLELVLFASGPDTLKLRLPTGQVFEAGGELPYPIGTRLTVQVQAPAQEGGAPRLKLLEALPPQAPAILAPLLQGEAAPLMARLVQPEVPATLRPLFRLLESLQDPTVPQAPPASRILAALETLPAPAVQALRQWAPLPSASLPELALVIRTWIGNTLEELAAPPLPASASAAPSPAAPAPAALPAPPLLAAPAAPILAQSLGPPPLPAPTAAPGPAPAAGSTAAPELARTASSPPVGPARPETGALPPSRPAANSVASVPGPEPQARTAVRVEPSPSPFSDRVTDSGSDLEPHPRPVLAKGGTDLVGLLILRLEAQLPARGELPAEVRDPLRALIRQLLQGLEAPAPLRSTAPATLRGVPAAPSAPSTPNARSEAGRPADALVHPPPVPSKTAVPAPPELPQAWETWIGSAMKALSDPKVSPREAPFHLAQAREGTAFFELPLPWGVPSAPLQIWIEPGLPDEEDGPPTEATPRVLVGLHFTTLGETRVGIQKSASLLQVRIWTERPELLSDRLPALKQELEEGEQPVDLRILPLGGGGTAVPSLRSVLAGSGFQALG